MQADDFAFAALDSGKLTCTFITCRAQLPFRYGSFHRLHRLFACFFFFLETRVLSAQGVQLQSQFDKPGVEQVDSLFRCETHACHDRHSRVELLLTPPFRFGLKLLYLTRNIVLLDGVHRLGMLGGCLVVRLVQRAFNLLKLHLPGRPLLRIFMPQRSHIAGLHHGLQILFSFFKSSMRAVDSLLVLVGRAFNRRLITLVDLSQLLLVLLDGLFTSLVAVNDLTQCDFFSLFAFTKLPLQVSKIFRAFKLQLLGQPVERINIFLFDRCLLSRLFALLFFRLRFSALFDRPFFRFAFVSAFFCRLFVASGKLFVDIFGDGRNRKSLTFYFTVGHGLL